MKARPALLSLALHAALLALLLLRFVPLWWHGRPRPPTRIAMIELVQQNSPVVDNRPPVAARPPSPKPPPPKPSVKPPPPPPPPAPPAPQASLPPPPPPAPPPPKPTPPAPQSPAPAPPTPTPPAPEAAAPEIRLGDMGDIGSGLVSGPAVIPARPDSTVHNAPPAYPVAAARRGEFGTVVLVVHIAPDGHASGVDVADSSGHDELDRAAREAVAKWQFRPAENNGLAVASSMVIDIHFNLTGKAR